MDARDGRRGFINITGSEQGDVVYYDKGIDEFVSSSAKPADEGSGASAAEAAEATGAELSTAEPPEGFFDPTPRSWWSTRASGCSWPRSGSRPTRRTATRSSTRGAGRAGH